MARIRVVLAEDNALLREGVSRLIDLEEGLELVGTPRTCRSSRRQAFGTTACVTSSRTGPVSR
jgi:DNA-binding NarL/FixJ family response regulator